MPEGPSLVILREEAAHFRRRTVRRVEGNSKLDLQRMHGRRVVAVRSWGKHFLLEFSSFSLRVHMLMFGTYRIDEPKPDRPPRLALHFDNGVLYFYSSSLKYVEGPLDGTYDWRVDVMSPQWDPKLARRKLNKQPDTMVCDALLDQDLFAGVGNIIKNEVLFRIRVQQYFPHPGKVFRLDCIVRRLHHDRRIVSREYRKVREIGAQVTRDQQPPFASFRTPVVCELIRVRPVHVRGADCAHGDVLIAVEIALVCNLRDNPRLRERRTHCAHPCA